MTDQPGVLHQPLDVFAAHQHHLFRIETEEGLLEGRPLGVHQTVLEPGTEDAQADQRQVAIVRDGSQLIGAARLRQPRFQRRRGTEAIEAVFVQPFVVVHGWAFRLIKRRQRVPRLAIACKPALRPPAGVVAAATPRPAHPHPPRMPQPRNRSAASRSSCSVPLQPRQPSVIDTP